MNRVQIPVAAVRQLVADAICDSDPMKVWERVSGLRHHRVTMSREPVMFTFTTRRDNLGVAFSVRRGAIAPLAVGPHKRAMRDAERVYNELAGIARAEALLVVGAPGFPLADLRPWIDKMRRLERIPAGLSAPLRRLGTLKGKPVVGGVYPEVGVIGIFGVLDVQDDRAVPSHIRRHAGRVRRCYGKLMSLLEVY